MLSIEIHIVYELGQEVIIIKKKVAVKLASNLHDHSQ